MSTNDVTYDYLRECLSYEPETGEFTWLERPESHFKNKKTHAINKTLHSGKKTGYLAGNGYVFIRIDNKLYRAHRLAWLYMYKEWPKEQLDHINGNRSDNRACNLRHTDNAGNRKNMCKRKDNASGITGVSWYKAYSKWMVVITDKKKPYFLGYFDSIFDAACARKSAERNLGFHINHGRETHGYN